MMKCNKLQRVILWSWLGYSVKFRIEIKMTSALDSPKEGVCDAYKYLQMINNNSLTNTDDDKQWHNKITRWVNYTTKQILDESGDKNHDRKYSIPETRLLKHCYDLSKLKRLINKGITQALFMDI